MGAIGTMRSPHYARELDKQAFECKENDCWLMSIAGFWLPLWHLQSCLATHRPVTHNAIVLDFIISDLDCIYFDSYILFKEADAINYPIMTI
jgi:uncharacterized membrane protein YccF (DUF307 family)